MHLVHPNDVTPALRALFDAADPAGLRYAAVLDGLTAGTILTDVADRPTWAAVREATDDGSTFVGGALDAPTLRHVVDRLRIGGDVLIGLWPDDPRLTLLPTDAEYDGWVLEWVGRDTRAPLEPFLRFPADCTVQPIDPALFRRCAGYAGICRHFGSEDRFFDLGLGFCLLDAGAIACEVFLCPAVRELRELWVETAAPYRRRGYATVTCDHAIRACEAVGQRTYWNTARQNSASAGLARKLGYGPGREYRLLGWSRRSPAPTGHSS
jgi:hypothetical protein